MLKALWLYREFILGCVKREFESKYRNSLLGAGWTVLNPLAMIVIYTVIFSQVMRARLPGLENTFAYSIYLCAGLLTWGLFAEITGRAQSMFLEHANLIKKLSFPRLCLPVIVVLNALLNFSILFGLFVVFLILSDNFTGLVFIALLPLLIILILFAIGLGICLGVLNVFFRDVGQFFSIFIQFWFWLSPIIYTKNALPASVRPWLELNPMTSLINGFQSVLVMGEWPHWQSLWPTFLLALLLCGMGFRLFRNHGGELVDEL